MKILWEDCSGHRQGLVRRACVGQWRLEVWDVSALAHPCFDGQVFAPNTPSPCLKTDRADSVQMALAATEKLFLDAMTPVIELAMSQAEAADEAIFEEARKADAQRWMKTFSSQRVHPFAITAEDVRVEDVAHATAMRCRYGGHCKEFYSVAEHSVRLSGIVRARGGTPAEVLSALVHDAGEYVLGDLPRPVKHAIEMLPYRLLEKRVQAAVNEAFEAEPVTKLVESAHAELFVTEVSQLFLDDDSETWGIPAKPIPGLKIKPWTPQLAKDRFLTAWGSVMAEIEAQSTPKPAATTP